MLDWITRIEVHVRSIRFAGSLGLIEVGFHRPRHSSQLINNTKGISEVGGCSHTKRSTEIFIPKISREPQ